MRAPRTTITLATLAVLAALPGLGCSDDGETEQTAGTERAGDAPGDVVSPTGETTTVAALDNSFNPETTTVAAGTEVIWENRGRNEHNVIPENEDPDWTFPAEDLQPGESVRYVFTTPGTYRYYCSIHGNVDVGMPGVIVVE